MNLLNSLLRLGTLGGFALALAAWPLAVTAQTNQPAAPVAKPTAAKRTAGPFRGKLAAMDKAAQTITVGKRTFHIVAETKLIKAGRPATFGDGVVGEPVSGGFKIAADGKLVATKVTFGPKTNDPTSAKKTKAKTNNSP